MSRNSLAIDLGLLSYEEGSGKPGLSSGFINAIILCLPVSLVIWTGIIYAATRLVR